MKKNRVIALVLYLFVVQFAVIGFLWHNPTFYWLSLINLCVFLIGGGIAWIFSKKRSFNFLPLFDRIGHGVYQFCRKYFFVIMLFLFLLALLDDLFWSILPFSYLWFGVLLLFVGILVFKDIIHKKVYFGRKIFFPKDVIFWGSVISVFWLSLLFQDRFMGYRFLVSIMIGFILFILLIRSFKVIRVFSFWKLRGTKLYLFGVIVFSIISGYQFLTHNFGEIAHTGNLAWENVQKGISWSYEKAKDGIQNIIPIQTGNNQIALMTGVGEVLDTQVSEIETGEDKITENEKIDSVLLEGSDEPLNFMDTIIYLFESNGIVLNTKKDIKFRYVSYKNPNYASFRTAYDMKLIGTTLNPEKRVLCDTYMVMKGLVQGRDIGRYTDIKAAYRSYAEKEDILHGCQRGEYLTERNL